MGIKYIDDQLGGNVSVKHGVTTFPSRSVLAIDGDNVDVTDLGSAIQVHIHNEHRVASVADLRALGGSVGERASLADPGGGEFERIASGTDDGGTVFVAPGYGTTGAAWKRVYSGGIDVKWYGAKGDGQRDFTADITSGNNFFTISGLTSADIGKLFTFRGAGVAGAELYGTITNVVGTTVTLSASASTTVTNKEFCWATDDTAAFVRAFAALSSAALSTRVLLVPRGIYGHTGLTMPGTCRITGQSSRQLNSIVGASHLRLMAAASQAYDVGAFSATFEDIVFDGSRLTDKVFKMRYLSTDSVFRRIVIMGAKTVAISGSGCLLYVAPDGAPFNEVDICNFERCVIVQNPEDFGTTEYCRFAANIDNNSNAFNLQLEHSYISNAEILFHYSAGSMNVRHCQLFRWVNACFYIESACQPFVIEDVYNEEPTLGPFLQIAFNAGVKSGKAITLREVDIQTDILTACTQHLVLENVWTAANINVEPAPIYGQYGVTSRNVTFTVAGKGYTGSGGETRVDYQNTVFDSFGTNIQATRLRQVAAPYDNSRDGPNTAVVQSGAGPALTITGTPTVGVRGLIYIITGGARGTATYAYSFDGGLTWEEDSLNTPITTAATDVLGTSGLTANFPVGTYVASEKYQWISGLGGEFGTHYWLPSLTANRTFPLIAALLAGQEVCVSLAGAAHDYTATITFNGSTLITLDRGKTLPSWARFKWDNSAGWLPLESGGGPVLGSSIAAKVTAVTADGTLFDLGDSNSDYIKLGETPATFGAIRLGNGFVNITSTSNAGTDQEFLLPWTDDNWYLGGSTPLMGFIFRIKSDKTFELYYGANQRHVLKDAAGWFSSGATKRFEWDGTGLAFYAGTPRAQPNITGALSTVADAAAKAVLTSIIAALTGAAGVNLATDGTT